MPRLCNAELLFSNIDVSMLVGAHVSIANADIGDRIRETLARHLSAAEICKSTCANVFWRPKIELNMTQSFTNSPPSRLAETHPSQEFLLVETGVSLLRLHLFRYLSPGFQGFPKTH